MKDIEASAKMLPMSVSTDGKTAVSSTGGNSQADEPSQKEVLFAVAGYMFCSALMLLANKLAVHYVPAPSFVLWCQLAGSALIVYLASKLGYIAIDKLELSSMGQFLFVPFAFLGTIFANIKILQHANVETFIVFRTSTPLLVSVADYLFLGRHLPDCRGLTSLLSILGAAIGYVYFDYKSQTKEDKGFDSTAYFWVFMWYVIFSFDQIFIKHAITKVKMTTWSRVFYTNLIASFPLLVAIFLTGEFSKVQKVLSQNVSSLMSFELSSCLPLLFLLLSIAIGCSIAFFSFRARAAVSATYFTVVGNACKILTVVINIMMWNNHATAPGVGCLLVALCASFFYKQAPMRE